LSDIHPTTVIEPGAQIAHDCHIGPFCYVGRNVTIGPGTRLLNHVSIHGRTTLGSANVVWPGAVLGGDPQDLKFHGEDTQLVIGDNNQIREAVTMHIGTENGGGVTRVGNNNLIMIEVHVAHDSLIGNNCVISNAVLLGGHVEIEDHASIGGAAAIHHYVTIGAYAFVGGMSRVTQDVPTFMILEGSPARVRGLNRIALMRHQVPEPSMARLKDAYRLLYRNHDEPASTNGLSLTERLAELEANSDNDPYVTRLIQFMHNMCDGIHGRHRETLRTDNRFTNPVK